MNILKDSAGYVTHKHIESRGFKVFETREINDMGQSTIQMPQYQNDKVKICGGYWSYTVRDTKTGKEIWQGWWNSNEEFDLTMAELGAL